MSANLSTDEKTGETSMWCVGDRNAAWHHLGQRTPDAQSWKEAMQLAHLDWSVEKRDLYARTPKGDVYQIPDTKGIFRTDTSAYLGTVGADYSILQNKLAFDGIDTLLAAKEGAHYESAGALGNGARIWVMARIPEAIRIIGTQDESKLFLLAATAHDGSMSYQFKLVAERVVCENTLSVALGEAGQVVRIKHSKNAIDRMAAAVRYMSQVTSSASTLDAKFNALAQRKMTKTSYDAVMDRLFPKTEDAGQSRRDGLLASILGLYDNNDKDAIPEIRGTAYNMLNAITEYTDHYRTSRITEGRKADGYTVDTARAENALFGTGDKLKNLALEVLLDYTALNPASCLV